MVLIKEKNCKVQINNVNEIMKLSTEIIYKFEG
jgi:hypothetical protein